LQAYRVKQPPGYGRKRLGLTPKSLIFVRRMSEHIAIPQQPRFLLNHLNAPNYHPVICDVGTRRTVTTADFDRFESHPGVVAASRRPRTVFSNQEIASEVTVTCKQIGEIIFVICLES
jgi:hypothetical protein